VEEGREGRVSLCGLGAAAVVLTAAKRLGAVRARLVRYETGVEDGNGNDSAVGYAGVILQ